MLIDVAMMVAMATVSVTGFMIYAIIPACHARKMALFGDIRRILDMSRHEWGEVHRVASIVLVALLLLHIVLHWSMISAFFKKHIRNTALRAVVYVLLLLLFVTTVAPWVYVVAMM